MFAEGNESRKGVLVLIGGDEDKSGERIILRRLVEINQAKRIAIIPTASAHPRKLAEQYLNAFKAVGVAATESVDIRNQRDASAAHYLEIIARSDLIFFTGGDQVKLVETLDDTPILKLIREQFAKGTTIAGTSAGAAAAGDPMLFDGDERGFQKGTVNVDRGFGLLSGVVVDTHFVRRRRISRLAQVLAQGCATLGIGLAEDTGIVIAPDHTFEVIGSGMVTVLDSRELAYSDYHEVAEEQQITIDGLRLSFLAAGATFSLTKRAVIPSSIRIE
ncbi:MAG: cyanophycinase [bacterium]